MRTVNKLENFTTFSTRKKLLDLQAFFHICVEISELFVVKFKACESSIAAITVDS